MQYFLFYSTKKDIFFNLKQNCTLWGQSPKCAILFSRYGQFVNRPYDIKSEQHLLMLASAKTRHGCSGTLLFNIPTFGIVKNVQNGQTEPEGCNRSCMWIQRGDSIAVMRAFATRNGKLYCLPKCTRKHAPSCWRVEARLH